MLSMFGGVQILDNAKDDIMKAIDTILHKTLHDLNSQTQDTQKLAEGFHQKAENIIDARLEELTASEVKNIISKMIKSHLSWLVVWGGIFGGLIGAISATII